MPQIQLINLLTFLSNLLISVSDFDEDSLQVLRDAQRSFFPLLVPKTLRTEPEAVNLLVELKRQIVLRARELKQEVNEEALFSVEEGDIERMLGDHEDAFPAVEKLRQDCQTAWKEVR